MVIRVCENTWNQIRRAFNSDTKGVGLGIHHGRRTSNFDTLEVTEMSPFHGLIINNDSPVTFHT